MAKGIGDGKINRPIRVPGSTDKEGLSTNIEAPAREPNGWRKRDGKRVTLYRMPGITPRKLLQKPFRFLVPPLEQISITYGHNSSSYQVVRGGEKSSTAGRKLRSVQFETLFVIGMYWWTIAENGREGYDPDRQVSILRQISEWEAAFRLVVSDYMENSVMINFPCQLPEVDVVEKAGEPIDKYVTVNFTEYSHAEVTRKALGGSDKDWPQYAKISANTTLSQLAREYYGKPSAASVIGESNHGLTHWGASSPIIQAKGWSVGDKIKIPDPSALNGGTTYQPNKASHSTDDAKDDRDASASVFGDD